MVYTKALLFGINYIATPDATLSGCIQDAFVMENLLRERYSMDTVVYTDDTTPDDTTAEGIIRRIYELANETHVKTIYSVVIYYSGHGSSISEYNTSNESDRRNETLVPSDYQTSGFIIDDILRVLLDMFHPETRVVCFFDSCHSGTLGDLPYRWEGRNPVINCPQPPMTSRVLTLSASLDNQVALEMESTTTGVSQGIFTECLHDLLYNTETTAIDCFKLVNKLQAELIKRKSTQTVILGSSYLLTEDPIVLIK